MTQSGERGTRPAAQDIALIVGGGPGISSSCARLFAANGMAVAVAARNPDKPVLETLEKKHGVIRYACDASEPAAVEQLFANVVRDLGTPRLVVHNIDGRVPGIFRKGIVEADPAMAFATIRNAALSAFLVGQQAAKLMLGNEPGANGARGTIIFTNASAGIKGFPLSGAFVMSCQVRTGAEHGARADAAGHPRRERADRRRDRLDPGRRHARTPAGRNDCRRQHGRPRPHRRNLSAAAPPASLDMGVRSRAPAVGRAMVTAAGYSEMTFLRIVISLQLFVGA